jgi:hypothetical protein
MRRFIFGLLASSVMLLSAFPMRASAAPHDFTVYNGMTQSIEYVNISPPDDTTWGDDWLGASEVIGTGDSRTFSVALGCLEDVRVTFMDHTQKEYRSFDTCQYDLRVNP